MEEVLLGVVDGFVLLDFIDVLVEVVLEVIVLGFGVRLLVFFDVLLVMGLVWMVEVV